MQGDLKRSGEEVQSCLYNFRTTQFNVIDYAMVQNFKNQQRYDIKRTKSNIQTDFF